MLLVLILSDSFQQQQIKNPRAKNLSFFLHPAQRLVLRCTVCCLGEHVPREKGLEWIERCLEQDVEYGIKNELFP